MSNKKITKTDESQVVNFKVDECDGLEIFGRIVKIGSYGLEVFGFDYSNKDFETAYRHAIGLLKPINVRGKKVILKSQDNFLTYISGLTSRTKEQVIHNIEELKLPKWEDVKQEFENQISSDEKETKAKRDKKLELRAMDVPSEPTIELVPLVPKYEIPVLRQLKRINKRSKFSMIDLVENNAMVEQGTLKIFVENYSNFKGLKTSALKLLDICTIYFTAQNKYRCDEEDICPTVKIPIEKYMELCGIPNTRNCREKTRNKVDADLGALFQIRIEWEEKRGKTKIVHRRRRICQKADLDHGDIIFKFSEEMSQCLTQSYIMQYPLELLKLSEKSGNAFGAGRRLTYHRSIKKNIERGTADILSVKTLLESCPDIPSYEEVMRTDKHVERRIIKPFEKALDTLTFVKWEYCRAKKEPLTDEQLASMDYKTFKDLYIKFEIEGTPSLYEEGKKIEAKAKEKKQITSKKKAKQLV